MEEISKTVSDCMNGLIPSGSPELEDGDYIAYLIPAMLLSHYTFKVVFPQYHCNQLYERDSYFVNLIVSRIV